jgi:23S rRNA A2030 N6-methylase RlmJ
VRLLVELGHAASMANRHFGKLADVWKHLVLAEVLAADRPQSLWDTHAGHAVYTMTTDAERRFGVLRFVDLAPSDATLAASGYFRLLERHMQGVSGLTEYPAGPMIAMLQLGARCEYCFCDVDPDSTANLRQAAARLGLRSQVRVVDGDGVAAVDEGLARSPDVSRAVVYIDPFDHQAVGPGGLSALGLCHKAANLGAAVICWYGYDRADGRNWLFNDLCDLSSRTRWWCGDIMITSDGADLSVGDLGVATSPGTGFGLVCANVPASALRRCEELGTALARAYDARPLPNGQAGGLNFATMEQRD